MDTSNLRTEFLANLSEINSSVSVCFSSTATLPTSVSPTEAAFAVTEALLQTQEDFNNAASAPPYLFVVTKAFNSNPLILDGHLVRSRERTINYQEVLGPVDVGAPTSPTKPVIS